MPPASTPRSQKNGDKAPIGVILFAFFTPYLLLLVLLELLGLDFTAWHWPILVFAFGSYVIIGLLPMKFTTGLLAVYSAWWKRRHPIIRHGSMVVWTLMGLMVLYRAILVMPVRMKFFVAGTKRYQGYSKLPAREGGAYLRGKVLTVDAESKGLDTLMFTLPKEMWATDPEKVDTVVFVRRDKFVSGHYTNGSEAITHYVRLDVVDTADTTKRFSRTFWGSDPPERIRVGQGDLSKSGAEGAYPRGFIEYLNGLPRR